MGKLPDGRNINVRNYKLVDGAPALEIQQNNNEKITIRYK